MPACSKIVIIIQASSVIPESGVEIPSHAFKPAIDFIRWLAQTFRQRPQIFIGAEENGVEEHILHQER